MKRLLLALRPRLHRLAAGAARAADSLYEITKVEPKVAVGGTGTASLTIKVKGRLARQRRGADQRRADAAGRRDRQEAEADARRSGRQQQGERPLRHPGHRDRGRQEDDRRRGALRALPGAGLQAGQGDASTLAIEVTPARRGQDEEDQERTRSRRGSDGFAGASPSRARDPLRVPNLAKLADDLLDPARELRAERADRR